MGPAPPAAGPTFAKESDVAQKFTSELVRLSPSDWAFSLEPPALADLREELQGEFQALSEDLRRLGADARHAQELAALLRVPLLAQDPERSQRVLREAPPALVDLLQRLESACPSSNLAAIRPQVTHLLERALSLSHRTAEALLQCIDHLLGLEPGAAVPSDLIPTAAFDFLLSILPPDSPVGESVGILQAESRLRARGTQDPSLDSAIRQDAIQDILGAVPGGLPLPGLGRTLDASRKAVEASLRAILGPSTCAHEEAARRHREAYDEERRRGWAEGGQVGAHTLLEDLHRIQAHLLGESRHHESMAREKLCVEDAESSSPGQWHLIRAAKYRADAHANLRVLRFALIDGVHPTETSPLESETSRAWIRRHGDFVRRILKVPGCPSNPVLPYDPSCAASAFARSKADRNQAQANAHLLTFVAAKAMRDFARAAALSLDSAPAARSRAAYAQENAAREHRRIVASPASEAHRAEHAALAEYHDATARTLISEASNPS